MTPPVDTAVDRNVADCGVDTDFKVTQFTIVRFGLYAACILFFSLGWILVDILLTFVSPFSDNDKNGLQLVTWGMLNIALIFGFKCMLCFKLYDGMIPLNIQALIVVVGCCLRIAIATFVRVPMYLQFRLFYDMTPEEQFSYWFDEVDSAGTVAATVLTLVLRNILDYWALPLCIHYFVQRSLNSDKSTVDIIRKKTLASHSSSVVAVVACWICAWCLFGIIGIFYTSTQPVLFVVVWMPLLVTMYVVYKDRLGQQTRPVAEKLYYSVGYLTLYLWLLDMIPEFCGNILNAFQDLSGEFSRFLASGAYLLIMLLLIEISKGVLNFAGKPRHNNIQLLAPVQFIKTFFDLLFFISIRLNDPVFFPILFLQMLALVIENAFGAATIFNYILSSAKKPVAPSAKDSQLSETEVRAKMAQSLQHERILRQIKLQEVLQKIIIDTVAISLLVVGYYSYMSYYRASAGDTAALINSYFYGIKTIQELDSLVLLEQFALILSVRLVTYCIPVYYLHRKLLEFNDRLSASSDNILQVQTSLKSAHGTDMHKSSSLDKLTPLDMWTIFFRHLDHGWWAFFLVSFIAGNRVCLMIRNVLLNSNDRVLLEIAIQFFGAANDSVLSKVTYWSISLVRRVLIG